MPKFKSSLAEVELDEEIRNLQAGAVVLEPYISMGATQAWQWLSFLQEELSRVFGAQQHQVPSTPICSAMNCFQLLLFLMLPSLQGIQVKATETSSTHLEKEMEKEADSFARKEAWIKAKISREDPVLP